MASVNKAILVGNLGADPETRYSPSGDAVCNIRIATTDRVRDKTSGEYKENTEWHRIVFFGKLAEVASQYLKKGRQVYVEGRIRTNKWQDKEGNERYTTEIIANEMKMLGSREGMGSPSGSESEYGGSMPSSNAPSAQRGTAPGKKPVDFNDMDDDIPF
jgi:single-strand DNA-binding protein